MRVATQCQPTTPTKTFLPHQRVTTEGKAMRKKIFTSTDSDKKSRGSVLVDVVRQLTDEEANNQSETGPMYLVRLPDGTYEHAFDDELTAA